MAFNCITTPYMQPDISQHKALLSSFTDGTAYSLTNVTENGSTIYQFRAQKYHNPTEADSICSQIIMGTLQTSAEGEHGTHATVFVRTCV